jgi:hypothetical protein
MLQFGSSDDPKARQQAIDERQDELEDGGEYTYVYEEGEEEWYAEEEGEEEMGLEEEGEEEMGLEEIAGEEKYSEEVVEREPFKLQPLRTKSRNSSLSESRLHSQMSQSQNGKKTLMQEIMIIVKKNQIVKRYLNMER